MVPRNQGVKKGHFWPDFWSYQQVLEPIFHQPRNFGTVFDNIHMYNTPQHHLKSLISLTCLTRLTNLICLTCLTRLTKPTPPNKALPPNNNPCIPEYFRIFASGLVAENDGQKRCIAVADSPLGVKREQCEIHWQSRCCKFRKRQPQASHCASPQTYGKAGAPEQSQKTCQTDSY